MSIEEYLQIHKARVADCNDEKFILTLLYEAYSDIHCLDDVHIKEAFCKCYRLMNGMPL